MPSDDIATVKRVFDAFAARDTARLEELSDENFILRSAVTGSAMGKDRYEGRAALAQFLADVDQIWTRIELRPQTFHSTREGQVLVAGSVLVEREGHTEELPAAWSWNLVGGKVTYVRVLTTAEASRLLEATAGPIPSD